MSKYIIKNCPVYKNNFCTIRDFYIQGCANCSDCVMKQIVEKCKEKYDYCFNKCKQSADEDIDCIECREGGQAELAAYFLSLLQIEECE